jgi:DNA-binding LacI/PurR family transcriptional regulator
MSGEEMMDRPPTMQDVARAAGVKTSRVRQYFSDSGMKINQAALSLGYLPDIVKNADGQGNHKHIAVITPFSTAYSFNERVRGVMNALPHRQYEVVHYHVETVDQLDHYLDSLASSGTCDGIILMSLPLSDKIAVVLQNKEIPLVSIERLFPGYSGISIDNSEGGRLAAWYLLKRGYKKPAFMGDVGNPEYTFSASALLLVDHIDNRKKTPVTVHYDVRIKERSTT